MATIYVDPVASGDNDGTDWNNAYTSLETALSASTSGDEVWCKRGLYYPDSTGYVVPENVAVYGGFAKELSGDAGSVSGRGDTDRSTVNGQDTYPGFKILENDVTVDGFNIFRCASSTRGGGIYIYGYGKYYYGPELLTDGDMEAVGTGDWSSGGTGVSLSKLATPTPPEGSQQMRVDSGSADCYAYQAILTASTTYRVTGYVYPDVNASGTARITDGTTDIWSNSTYDEWISVDEEFTATDTDFTLKSFFVETSALAYFDGFSVKEKVDNYITGITINNCWITRCTATEDGAGISVDYCVDSTISNCFLSTNTATQDGGGIYLDDTDGITIEDCTFDTNIAGSGSYGGGSINVATSSNTTVKNTIMKYGEANYGGNVYTAGGLDLINCVIYGGGAGGGATYGGGIAADGTNTATNCTIADNTYEGVIAWSGSVTIVNSIIWGNATQLSASGGSINATYSDVQGGYSGTGNVTGTPSFVEDGLHYYALAAICAAVDSGNSGATNYETTDLVGASRYDHPSVSNTGAGSPAYSDMGAYEFQGTPIHTMPMQLYKLQLNTNTSTDYYYMYAVVRLPEMPSQFGGGAWGTSNSRGGMYRELHPSPLRHEIQSEIYSNDADSQLEEVVMNGQHNVAYRTVSGSVTPPSRDVAYETEYQKEGDTYTAVERQDPDPLLFSKMATSEFEYWFCILEFRWQPQYDTGSELTVYNVDVQQIHDNEYEYEALEQGVRPGATWMAPDVPLSAAHMHTLQDAILKMLYEGVTSISIPVFGQFSIPVV